MSPEVLASVSLWATILQWVVIAALFVIDALRVNLRAERSYKRVQDYQDGARVVALFRRNTSRWYVVGAGIALALGLLATYRGIYFPEPAPKFQIISSVIRQGIVVMLFAFWRTKRLNVTLQRQIDHRRYEETGRRSQ